MILWPTTIVRIRYNDSFLKSQPEDTRRITNVLSKKMRGVSVSAEKKKSPHAPTRHTTSQLTSKPAALSIPLSFPRTASRHPTPGNLPRRIMTSYGEARLTQAPRANFVDDLTTVSGEPTEETNLSQRRRRYVQRGLLQIDGVCSPATLAGEVEELKTDDVVG